MHQKLEENGFAVIHEIWPCPQRIFVLSEEGKKGG